MLYFITVCPYFPFDPITIYLHIKQCAVCKHNVTRQSSSDKQTSGKTNAQRTGHESTTRLEEVNVDANCPVHMNYYICVTDRWN